jgi:hypothetical protein
MTNTKGTPALTLITSGWKRFFSMASGIDAGVSATVSSGPPVE